LRNDWRRQRWFCVPYRTVYAPIAMSLAALTLENESAALRGARARAFEAARRHTTRVRLLRRAVEFTVVGTIAISFALAGYRNFARALRDVAFEGIGIDGGKITMDKPRLSGSRPGGGGYVITAVKAMQDPRNTSEVDLALIGGDITTADHEVSRLSAESGHYESADETLDLAGDVRLKNSHYEIFLRSVHIAFKTGGYVSKEPVKVRIFPDTDITADAFEVKDGGAEALFDGRVHTIMGMQGRSEIPAGTSP
jgi:lipopolysaccharide export system protein LptC